MDSISYKVPAKINLHLRLTGKRKDGFNGLCSVFQKIGLYDELSVAKSTGRFSLDVEGIKPCSVKDNLVYKAYRFLKDEVGFKGSVSVKLKKGIPAGSGLGGASADAAYMLHALNNLFDLGLADEELAVFGRRLGSDVPFFIYSSAFSLGIERGDVLLPIEPPKPFWLLLLTFDKGLSTKDVYAEVKYPKGFQISLTKTMGEVIMLTQILRNRRMEGLKGCMFNDLSEPAFKLRPQLETILHSFERDTQTFCAMTGSGPTLFALFESKKDADNALKKVSYKGTKTILCRTLIRNSVN